MLKVGKRLLITVANLNDFVDSELAEAEKNEKFERGAEKNSVAAQTLKYWIALAGRADVVADKVENNSFNLNLYFIPILLAALPSPSQC